MDFGEAPRPSVDTEGRLYGRPRAMPDETLVRSGPGTPGGELLRRYWQPLALATDVKDLPVPVKIFGEELVLFRGGNGIPGLLYPRCMHRGTSLLFGKVEEDGLRCCYHGWKFDAVGHCIDMACEPGSEQMGRVRQPWYPLVEKWGIIFTYMGPAERQPLFPRISICEDLGDDEEIVAVGGLANAGNNRFRTEFNWWTVRDDVMDPYHLYFLHSNLNGIQLISSWKAMPKVEFRATPDGALSYAYRDLEGGGVLLRIGQSFMPNLNATDTTSDKPCQSGVDWTIAIDDTSYRSFLLMRRKRGVPESMEEFAKTGIGSGSWGGMYKSIDEPWTLEDRQRWQSDYETQGGQGEISLHSDDHLSAKLDGGVSIIRRMFKQNAEIVAQGGDPVGVTFDEPYLYNVAAGVAILTDGKKTGVAGFDERITARGAATGIGLQGPNSD